MEQTARNPGDEFGDGNIRSHSIDGRAANPVAHTGANAKKMDILQEERGARSITATLSTCSRLNAYGGCEIPL